MRNVDVKIPVGWLEVTLGELTYFVNDKIPVSEVNLTDYISTENLLANRLGVVDASKLPNTSKVNNYKIGDTLFSNIRTYFKKVWYSDKEGGSSNDVLIFRPRNEKELDNKFLFYFISSDDFIDFTVKSAKGTKMPRGDKNAISTLSISIPKDLKEQKAIAKVLTVFDDKIENLRTQNKTLEQTAQIIFKEWFGKHQIGDVLPDDWSYDSLNKIAIHLKDNIKPFNYPDKEFNHYSLPAYDDGLRPVKEKGIEIKSSKYSVIASSFLVSKLNPFTPRIWTIYEAEKNHICSTEFQIVKPKKDIYFSLIHCFLNSKKFTNELSQKVKGTSGSHQRVNPQDIFDVKLVISNEETIIKFNKIVDSIVLKKNINHQQIQTLTKTRDSLLPKLMRGDIRVNGFKNN